MPQKRKQTPDMPQSPPKRVTRARAKKDIDSKAEKTRIMTPSAKASAQRKGAEQPIKPNKAKAQLAEEIDADPEPDTVPEESFAEPPKTRGKAKATTDTSAKTPVAPSPKAAPVTTTRSRSAKSAVTAKKDAQLPKTMGRSKRTARDEPPAAPETVEEATMKQLPPKVTRGRTAATVTKPPSARTRAATAAPTKKVKFDHQSDQDKENQPILVEAQKKPQSKPTGLRAKPIRKPAAVKGGTRRTKTSKQSTATEETTIKEALMPLSPKKITQVAKTPSAGSEDELVGDKTPVKILNKSPSKIPMSVSHAANSMSSEPQTEKVDVPESPKKAASGGLATSPRKPPPSPFKNALKTSPRKVDLGSRPTQPRFDAPSSPSKSPLKESPKRINLGDSSVPPFLQWSRSPVKSSLLQSPARRPGGSPTKASTVALTPSGDYAAVPTMDAITASEQVNAAKLPRMLFESAASSPLRAAKSPGQSPKVYNPAMKEQSNDSAGTLVTSSSKRLEVRPLDSPLESEVCNTSPGPEGVSKEVIEATVSENPQAHIQQNIPISFDLERLSTSPFDAASNTDNEDIHSDLQETNAAAYNVDTEPMPSEPPNIFTKPAFVISSSMLADKVEEAESEDELASPEKLASPSPLKTFGISTRDFGTPSISGTAKRNDGLGNIYQASTRRSQRSSIAMTPLAMQMSSWLASSPGKKNGDQTIYRRGVFSPAKPIFPVPADQSPSSIAVGSPAKPTFFDDEMAVRDTEDGVPVVEGDSIDELQEGGDDHHLDIQASQESQETETYGDENAAPEDSAHYLVEQEEENHILTCTPAKAFEQQSREVHTVSKVPLRPAADDTPLLVPKKRRRSLAGPLADISMPDRLSISRDSILSPILHDRNLSMSMLPGDPTVPDGPETPTAGSKSASNTPGRSVRKAGYSSVLKGAVVHVDVHTTEGADASGIFVDLLTQMGARCVKQWHWNPQGSLSSSTGNSPNHAVSPDFGTSGGKIGITHVVYKDGGKRTLEKVREAKGAVVCVGVGWVLDCERADKWLNETDYAVDTSIVPRGGCRRRKSMEPRALANLNGSLVLAETPVKAPPADISPTKEFLNLDTPMSRRDTFEFKVEAPATPAIEMPMIGERGDDFESPLSPTTPYYLSKGSRLVQQTCPPKQSQELFFPLTGNIEDQPNQAVRQRLLAARRKSLQWASKVQSPLGRTVSYGK
ncbi:MAG: hypothetical protein LQ338_006212 [Usnochroma carphineum]|nr:MAG: hypothetical protein LQ338_006212 [Usnochroma carphineum]